MRSALLFVVLFILPRQGRCAQAAPPFDPAQYQKEKEASCAAHLCKHKPGAPIDEKCAARCAASSKSSSSINVSDQKDWKGWLRHYFPDASAKWDEGAGGSFSAPGGRTAWDFIGKGDFYEDGAPTALLIKTQRLPAGRLVVSRLLVMRWLDGSWKPLLDLDHGRSKIGGAVPKALSNPDIAWFGVDFRLDLGKDRNDDDFPGLGIGTAILNKDGRGMGDGCLFKLPHKATEFYFECG